MPVATESTLPETEESVQACLKLQNEPLAISHQKMADCLGFETTSCKVGLCGGRYKPIEIIPFPDNRVQIRSDSASFYQNEDSLLRGHVNVQQYDRSLGAQTALIRRDAKTRKIKEIILQGDVYFIEPGKMMVAQKAIISPETQAGRIEAVWYRFDLPYGGALLPASGYAAKIERFENKNICLKKASYTVCSPKNPSWEIEADSIFLNHAAETGVARNARLRFKDWTLLYTPYLSFPTSKKRKSGFLMPLFGHSNVNGFDWAWPYYFNLAPNYDATLIPHWYSKRGLMLQGEYRYLSPEAFGVIHANFLPQDRAFKQFLLENQPLYPQLSDLSSNRWSFQIQERRSITERLLFDLNYQKVSDDYYLQHFSNNLSVLTERQLLREGTLSYRAPHWYLQAQVQRYQTLNPINETPILPAYERLPQLLFTMDANHLLPAYLQFNLNGQFDYFHWPNEDMIGPQGARSHINPVLSLELRNTWMETILGGDWVGNRYDLGNRYDFRNNNWFTTDQSLSLSVPRIYLDQRLFLERSFTWGHQNWHQVLEPRIYYLYVPYQNQAVIPNFDSAYMIFNYDQLFRKNRFSGFDRIGDTNQLSYALSSSWFNDETGVEKASLSLGQIRYFSKRRVQLCQSPTGYCTDSDLILGYLPPLSRYSPFAARATYSLDQAWQILGDYVFSGGEQGFNSVYMNLHYEPAMNHIVNLGYSYLSNGDQTKVAYSQLEDNALNQASLSYAWPLNDHWSSLGGYSYNLSKHYEMLSFLGVQYDSCCWAIRLLGARTFKSLNPVLEPQYNQNFYLQILLKGLGSVASSDPMSTIQSFLPSYQDPFHHFLF